MRQTCYCFVADMTIEYFIVGPSGANNQQEAQHKELMMLLTHVIREFRSVAIRISKDVKAKRDKLVEDRICLVCEEPLGKRPSRRGECPTCRAFTERKVKAGLCTEESLIREGKLLEGPTVPRGGHHKAHEKRQALIRECN